MKNTMMDGMEAMELVELLGRLKEMKLEQTDLARREEVLRDESLTPMDGLVDSLRNNRTLRRRMESRQVVRPKAKKKHWKEAKRLRRERYLHVIKPQRNARKASSLTTPEGWWKEASLNWRKSAKKGRESSKEPTITEEEFTEVIYPCFAEKGRIPIFKRLDTMKGVSLENLLVVDMHTQEVLFDGNDYLLRKLGYAL